MFTKFSLRKVVARISTIAAYGGASLVFPWVLVFTLYVILRDFFHINWIFVEEYTQHWLVIVICLAMAYTLRQGGHIRITTAFDLLAQRVRNIIYLVTTIIALVTSCILVQHGVGHLLMGIREGLHYQAASQSLLWPFYLWIPIGFGLLSLELLLHLWEAIIKVGKDLGKTKSTG